MSQTCDPNFALAKFVCRGLAEREKEAKARFRPFLSEGVERCPLKNQGVHLPNSGVRSM